MQFLCVPPFFVAGSILLVAYCRSGEFSTGVVAAGAARPAVVVWGAVGGLDACSAELLSKVGDGNMKFGKVLQGDEELGVGGSAVCGSSIAMKIWELLEVQSVVSVLLVAVRAVTEARSLTVAVARFAMASTVSFW